jgi:hypothetical protein
MDSYFVCLARKALLAKETNHEKIRKQVLDLIPGAKEPQQKQDQTTDIRAQPKAGLSRDQLQALIAKALSPGDDLPAQNGNLLKSQVNNLVARINQIKELLAIVEAQFGDWGWKKQVGYLGQKYDIGTLTTEGLKDFLGDRLPVIQQSKERRETKGTGRQDLNRLHDSEVLVKSYVPLIARRLAAELTLSERIAKIFEEYGLSADEQAEDHLSKILAGESFPKKIDPQCPGDPASGEIRKRFESWPCAAVGGSFAQALALALDFRPSTWALARELDSQGIGGDGSDQNPPSVGGLGHQPPGDSGPRATPNDRAWQAGLMGLALSGGGIRSATFNLGILQGLASLGLLRRFNYLSTVSGGGYIGAWLINWIKRKGVDEVEKRLCPDSSPDPRDPRLEPVRFLRDFSNYLTPQMGLLSADMWVMAVVWFRNTFLNLLVLLPAVLAVMLIPRIPELWAQSIAVTQFTSFDCWTAERWPLYIALSRWYVVGLLPFACFTILIALNLGQFPADENDIGGPEVSKRQRFYSRPWGVLAFIVLPIFVAAWFAAIELWAHATDKGYWEWSFAGIWGAITAGVILLMAKYPWRFGDDRRHKLTFRGVSAMVLILVTLGGITALLTLGLERIFGFWRGHDLPNIRSSAAVTVFGVPLIVSALFLTLVLLAGFMSQKLTDGGSKWLVRMRAYVAIYGSIWLVWTGIAIYGPWLFDNLLLHRRWYAKLPVAAAWIWTTLRGVLAGKSADTHGGKADWKSSLGFYATVGPYVFIVGLFWVMSVAADRALHVFTDYLSASDPDQSWLSTFLPCAIVGHEWTWSVFIILTAAAFLAVWLSFWFDVNEFSLNKFYRSRLVRCYLGASNDDRKPNPFTGFDPTDDAIPLACFQRQPDSKFCDRFPQYQGPFPIFNATLNLVHGDELAWQERRGASFVFTPELCGYETPWHAPANPQPFEKLEFLGYRETKDYAYRDPGMHLGTPMSISGAALSPNMGFYSRPATGFLMTIFNARLGWWLGNPRHKKTWTKAGPTQGLAYLTKELMGLTNDRAGFVYVSDGGHFENLALYELVRRRCRYIVACDGEEDAALAFNGLGNAIRKCRMDFGVEIDIGVDLIKPESAALLSRSHCVVGTIQYPDQVGLGYLVYLKASIVGNEPEDVLQYRVSHPAFPHQSTGDQWFTESQFESYRRLGLHVAETTFKRAVGDVNQQGTIGSPKNLDEEEKKYRQQLFEELRDNWYPPVKAIQANFTRHAQALDQLVQEMRQDEILVKLYDFLIPGRDSKAIQISDDNKPKVFLFLSSVIQLMENIYIDLDLEANADHPHCAGWIQIFQAWAESHIFQQAWQRYGATYGRNFRRFCNRRFGLPI